MRAPTEWGGSSFILPPFLVSSWLQVRVQLMVVVKLSLLARDEDEEDVGCAIDFSIAMFTASMAFLGI